MSGYNYKIKMQNGQRTKILFVITKSVWGGAQRYVFDLATNLPKDQFDVAVACSPVPPSNLVGETAQKTNTETLSEKLKDIVTVFSIAHFQKSIKEISGSDALMTLISILPLAIGLSIVLGHNVWKMHWSVLITIMGWLILVISICRLFFYKKIMQIMAIKSEQKYFVMTMGVIIIIIGAVLSYLGFIGK